MSYENCDICGHNILLPWSSCDSVVAKYNLRPAVVICTEQCYFDNLADQAEHRYDCMMDR